MVQIVNQNFFFLFNADLFSNICFFGKRYFGGVTKILHSVKKVFFELDLFLKNEFYMNPI